MIVWCSRRDQVAARQAGIDRVIAAANKMDVAGYEYDGPTPVALLGVEEKAAV